MNSIELHNAIMNLPVNPHNCPGTMHHSRGAYVQGHRDARHAAAELALSAFDLDTQCKIAFAEMWAADHQGNSEKHFWYGVVAAAQDRYGRGERTEELCELMRQATRELTSK